MERSKEFLITVIETAKRLDFDHLLRIIRKGSHPHVWKAAKKKIDLHDLGVTELFELGTAMTSFLTDDEGQKDLDLIWIIAGEKMDLDDLIEKLNKNEKIPGVVVATVLKKYRFEDMRTYQLVKILETYDDSQGWETVSYKLEKGHAFSTDTLISIILANFDRDRFRLCQRALDRLQH